MQAVNAWFVCLLLCKMNRRLFSHQSLWTAIQIMTVRARGGGGGRSLDMPLFPHIAHSLMVIKVCDSAHCSRISLDWTRKLVVARMHRGDQVSTSERIRSVTKIVYSAVQSCVCTAAPGQWLDEMFLKVRVHVVRPAHTCFRWLPDFVLNATNNVVGSTCGSQQMSQL
jgi:hypothetical protein